MTAFSPRPAPAVETKHILIVEDEKDLVRMIQRTLEKEGYRVSAAGTAEAGLKLARESAPSLILLDIVLPAMDGLSFLRLLRRESDVPVVLLSGRASDVDRILGLKAGADDYVAKPFSMGELAARIEGHLRRRAGAAPKKRRP